MVLIGAALLAAGVFLNPRLMHARRWHAIVTPLASIIGSGFLVAGPILAGSAGIWAWLAMASLCAVGYLFGSAIRYNIAHVEPLLAASPPPVVAWLERSSDLTLSLAYFVSVAYYIHLFAAFGLRMGAVFDPFWIRIVATGVIGAIGALGFFGGLASLERLIVGAVGLKLSLIAALLAALAYAGVQGIASGNFVWPTLTHSHGIHEITILLGLVILVQGFETSRYLGDAYDAPTRIATMRQAQWISTAIYIVFILLITRYFGDNGPGAGEATEIIDMLAPLGIALAPLIILAALASQLSAAVADTSGAGGLLAETLSGRIGVNVGNLVTALVAIGIIWAANIYEIIVYASKAFVIYYGLQSLQAARMSFQARRWLLTVVYAMGVLIAAVVIVFSVPADV